MLLVTEGDLPVRQAERFYDGHAESYESKFDHAVARRIKRMEEQAILAFLFEHLPAEGRLLELGCGTGLFTLPVAARGYEITAVDISSKMLEQLQGKLDAASIRNVSLLKADVEELPSLGTFDGVYGIGLLEYLASPEEFVRRVARLLGPGGVACFTGPTLSASGLLYRLLSRFRKRMAMKLFTRRRMRRLYTGAGLVPVEVREVGFHLPLMKPLTRVAAARKAATADERGGLGTTDEHG